MRVKKTSNLLSFLTFCFLYQLLSKIARFRDSVLEDYKLLRFKISDYSFI